MSEFSTMQQGVEHILRTYPETRNSDRLLYILYWKDVQGYEVPAGFRHLLLHRKLANPAEIKRVRAKIQNKEGILLPTDPEILRKRRQRREEVTDWAVNRDD